MMMAVVVTNTSLCRSNSIMRMSVEKFYLFI